MTMRAHVFCTLPEVISSTVESGAIRIAREAGVLEVFLYDLHRLSPDPHHRIDDAPYGGGPGMVLRVDIVAAALETVFGMDAPLVKEHFPVILLSPQGERFDQGKAKLIAEEECVAFICGRYEGVDERVAMHLASHELSIGDFVLSGGEIAVAAVIEAAARLLPGVLGNRRSLEEESFSRPILEYPHYTRPSSFRGWDVPDVLMSGDHGRIEEWRESQALERTRRKRPDLLGGR